MLSLFLCGLTAAAGGAAVVTAWRIARYLALLAQELDAQAAILLALAARLDDLERLAYGLPVGEAEERRA